MDHPAFFNRFRLFGNPAPPRPTQPSPQAQAPAAVRLPSTPTPAEAPHTRAECESVLARIEKDVVAARKELTEAELRLSRLRKEFANTVQERDAARIRGKVDRKREDSVDVLEAQIGIAQRDIRTAQETIESFRAEADAVGQALARIADAERRDAELQKIARAMDARSLDMHTIIKLTAQYTATVEDFRRQAEREHDSVIAHNLRLAADRLSRAWQGIREEDAWPQPRKPN